MDAAGPGAEVSTVTQERLTHTYLRVLMVVMAFLMLLAVLVAWLVLDVTAPSLSEYYDNALRDVFVGMLFAIAVCMVAYKGVALEDWSLNVAGFYALFVALVPTNLASLLDTGEASVAALRLNLLAVLVVAGLFLWFDWWSGLWAPERLFRNRVTRWFLLIGIAYFVAFMGLLTFRTFEGEVFANVHLMAAVGLIASLAIAVSSHAWPEETDSGAEQAHDKQGVPRHRTYRLIVLMMALGLALWALLAAVDFSHAVLVVELWELFWFMAFWVMETRRTWPPRRVPQVHSGRGSTSATLG